MAKKFLPLVVSIQFLLALTLGCGSSNMMPPPPPVSQSEFLYATTFDPQGTNSKLMTFKLDLETGVLTSTSNVAMPPTFGVVADPASKFLYLSDPNPMVHAIDIDSIDPKSGLLTPNAGFVVDGGICPFCPPLSGPGPLTMDSKGKFLYYGSNTFGGGLSEVIGGLSVNSSNGSLSLVPGSPFPADGVPFGVLVHPSGHFLYTENLPTIAPVFAVQSISGFSIDSTGALTPVPGSPFTPPVNADAPGFAMHPTGKFLYASAGAAGNGILAWSVDSTTGVLTPLPASPFVAGTTPVGVAMNPSGKFLYSSNGVGGGIWGFTVDAGSGALTPMSGSPFNPSTVVSECVSDPSGKFLVAMDSKNKAIIVFSINSSTGTLSPIGNPVPVGAITLSLVLAKAPQ